MWTCIYAAKGGNLDCLIYARDNGCKWNETTCAAAAEKGNLNCLKYAHEHGCEWTSDTCGIVAWAGHLECLKYARGMRGLPYSPCQNTHILLNIVMIMDAFGMDMKNF